MSRPTARLKDIAALTGFSINTVSVALRGRPHIPEATRARVLEVARGLNYLPNAVARSLVSRTTRTIGVVLTNILNPILTQVVQAIEENLVTLGYGAVFSFSDHDVAKERDVLDRLLERQVDGILIYPANHDQVDHLIHLRARGVPVVLLTRVTNAEFDVVSLDDRKGAALITRHLLELGHRKVAFLDASQKHGNREKLLGYNDALLEEGLAPSAPLIVTPEGNSPLHGYQAMPTLMTASKRPTAILASADSLAIGVLRWCRENAVRVPDDLAVAGFDNIEVSGFLDVPLTTVSYPPGQVAKAAVHRMIELVGLPQSSRNALVHVIDPQLVVRTSSGKPWPATTGKTSSHTRQPPSRRRSASQSRKHRASLQEALK